MMKKLIALLALLAIPCFGAQLRLVWDNPTTNEDGSPLTDLAWINIYENGTLLTVLDVAGQEGAPMQYELGERGEGTYTYTATAVDAAGNESLPSNEATVSIDETAPAAPVSVTVIISVQ